MERLLDYFVPERYSLNLLLNKKEKTISGTVGIIGKVESEIIKFHAVDMEINSVLLDGANVEYEIKDKTLIIKNVPKEVSKITIEYQGKLSEKMEGAYLSTYDYNGKTETIVATQFESHYAREAFPCIDEPAAKAVFELTLTTDEDDEVLSNMPMLKQTADAGFKTVSFEPTPRMSVYLLAWVVGKFHGKTIVNSHGVEITTYVALNQDLDSVDFANEVAARSLEFYDDNFGVPYPLKKCTQVALPDFEAGAMENWGLVTYRESMMLAGESATTDTKKGVALTVAHELAHQWFGDLVTMKWWDDLWLNESFASIMEYYAVDAIYPEFKIWEGFFTGDCLLALKRDCLSGVQSVHQNVENPAEIMTLFDPAIVYSKGARLMLMVIRTMGWDNFCKGVKDYFEKYKYSNTCGDDLWTALNTYASFDVKKMMHAFIDKPGYPVLENTGVDFDTFKQKRFLIDGEMPTSNWLVPEVFEDMGGHYVLRLTEEEFEDRLARFDELGLEEKLRLLIDRDLLARTDLVSSASLLTLLSKFRNESSAAVWSVILSIVSGLKVFFDYKSEEEQKFRMFVKQLVAPKLNEIGLKTLETDDENIMRLRSILLGLDFFAENEENLRTLASMYNEDYSKLDLEIRNDILDAKVYLEPEMVDKYLDNYKNTADPEIKSELLFAVTLPREKRILNKIMGLLNQPEIVKPQDQLYLFIYLYRNPEIKADVFKWLKENWDYIKSLMGDKSLDNYARYTANLVRTKDEYDAWWEFYGPMSNDPVVARAVEMGKNEIEARIKLIETDREAIYKELDKEL